MIDTAIPTALMGEIGGGLTVTVAAEPARAAAEEAIGPGRTFEEAVAAAAAAGFSIFLAES
jgi:hypothetical protein